MSGGDEKEHVVDGIRYRYSTEWINSLENKEHWALYWQQQAIMQGLVSAGDHFLEIGVGSHFTANYLKSKGFQVTTIDIDAAKDPDIVANIVEYDFPDTYDHILGFEVFEHIPFRQFELALPRMAAACRKHLFFSVPVNKRAVLGFTVKLPKLRPITAAWERPRRQISDHHFWEINHEGLTMEAVFAMFRPAGFELRRQQEAGDRLFIALESTGPPATASPE